MKQGNVRIGPPNRNRITLLGGLLSFAPPLHDVQVTPVTIQSVITLYMS